MSMGLGLGLGAQFGGGIVPSDILALLPDGTVQIANWTGSAFVINGVTYDTATYPALANLLNDPPGPPVALGTPAWTPSGTPTTGTALTVVNGAPIVYVGTQPTPATSWLEGATVVGTGPTYTTVANDSTVGLIVSQTFTNEYGTSAPVTATVLAPATFNPIDAITAGRGSHYDVAGLSGSVATLNDLSVNGRNLTGSGTTLPTATGGVLTTVSGQNQVYVNNTAAFICANTDWVIYSKVRSSNLAQMALWSEAVTTGATPRVHNYLYDYLSLEWLDDTGSILLSQYSFPASTMIDGAWHVVKQQLSAGTYSIYVDGALFKSIAAPSNATTHTASLSLLAELIGTSPAASFIGDFKAFSVLLSPTSTELTQMDSWYAAR